MLVLSLMILAIPGCFLVTQKGHATRPAVTRPQPKPVDAKSQQHYYDIGLQQYSKENYRAAKEAFQQSIDFGPNTSLAGKAQENIRKIDRILQTLEEIESK
jgi:outer membrane protein assembly factor BamD (BamD/ComL family)